MNEQLIAELIKLATIRVNNPLVNSDGKVILDDWEEGVSMSKLIELTVRNCALTAGLMEQEGRKGIGAQLLDNYGIT
jgi:hypothetical protein